MKHTLPLIFFLLACSINAQEPGKSNLYKYEEEITKLDSLKAKFGKNKNLPPGYELQALIALSHYPQLQEEHIDFVFKKAKYPYYSHPQFRTLIIPFVKEKILHFY